VQYAELGLHAHLLDLVFEQQLDRLVERLLNLADTNPARAGIEQTALDQKLSEEMRLARAAASPRALVSGRLQEVLICDRRFKPQRIDVGLALSLPASVRLCPLRTNWSRRG
jgi:hypothetical protein